MRGARDLGLEPRIVAPAGVPGIGARLAITFPLQGPRTGEAFQATSAALADFIANYCRAEGTAPDPGLRAKAAMAVMKAAERSTAGLDIPQVAAMLSAALPSAHPLRSKALEALQHVADAERAAGAFATPVGWNKLLAPSPAGRAPAILFQLSSLSEIQADFVEELALASLCAQQAEGALALGSGPVGWLSRAPRGPLGQWAAGRLATTPTEASLTILGLFMARAEGPQNRSGPSIGKAQVEGDFLRWPGGATPLPMAEAAPVEPLLEAEARSLTPATLSARILGAPAGEEDEPGAPSEGPARKGAATAEAIREVAGDLTQLAGKRARGGLPSPAKKKVDYEAADFDLK
jgi:hypothetical protein